MLRASFALVVLFFLGTALSAGGVQLGSFEGTYTSNFNDLGGLYLCQNDRLVSGFDSESFMIRGYINDDGDLIGNFYQAGSGNCAAGTIALSQTQYGFVGFYVCGGNNERHPYNADKLSEFRPSDDRCALLSSDDDDQLEGRWIDNDNLIMDLCFRDPDDDAGDDDDETVQGSYQRMDEDGNIIDRFISGFHYAKGKVFVGTWYEDFLGGAVIMYNKADGNVGYSWWTGMLYNNGGTFIDQNQLGKEDLHQIGFFNGPVLTSTANECVRYEVLQTFVLKNLRPDDDDNFYYFVSTKYFTSDDVIYFIDTSARSPASVIVVSIALVFSAIMLLL